MAQTIEIDGGIARVIERRIVAQAPLDQLAPFLEVRLPTILPVLPDHTRLIAFDPNTKKGVLMVETIPFRQWVTCHADPNDYNFAPDDQDRLRAAKDHRAAWNVLFPYQYHAYDFLLDTGPSGVGVQNFQLNAGFLYWRPTKFTKLEDELWPAQLFNIDTNARICWGYTQAETASLAQRIDDQVKSFQATIFNTHLGAKKPVSYGSYVEWEKAADKNPLDFLNWPEFKKKGITTGKKLVEQISALGAVPADLDNTTSIIPPPPDTFTIGKAVDWFNRIDPQQRKLFARALERAIAEAPEAVTATAEAGKKAEVVGG